jgi:HK97 family phage prohead protease
MHDMSYKSMDNGTLRITGYASTPSQDRLKEVVDVHAFAGTLDSYMRNPIILVQHDANRPVGLIDSATIDAHGLRVSGLIISGTAASDEAQRLVRQGVWKTLSAVTAPRQLLVCPQAR